ncbi:hypothetical protein [Micromonospora coerulea]|uniref:hypothetical protein n=1 Tax=Micromonospora coerulea TaxID=47856 RepID=UPI0019071C30|nr:hypothetical protein [Micromonospora veneta]
MSVAVNLERFAGAMPQAPPGGVTVARVNVFDSRAWIAYRRDEDQGRLRHRHGIEPILGLDVLDTLMDLPLGLPVPVDALSAADRGRLRRLPAGAVLWSAATVTRRVAPPVTPTLAMVRSADWMGGLRAASRFAVYCPRMVIVAALPPDSAAALSQASFYGIGVAVHRDGRPEVVLAPESVADRQPTPAWWWFTEVVHRAAGLSGS